MRAWNDPGSLNLGAWEKPAGLGFSGRKICVWRCLRGAGAPVPPHPGTCGLEDTGIAEAVASGERLHHPVNLLGLARQPEAPEELPGGRTGLWAAAWAGASGGPGQATLRPPGLVSLSCKCQLSSASTRRWEVSKKRLSSPPESRGECAALCPPVSSAFCGQHPSSVSTGLSACPGSAAPPAGHQVPPSDCEPWASPRHQGPAPLGLMNE